MNLQLKVQNKVKYYLLWMLLSSWIIINTNITMTSPIIICIIIIITKCITVSLFVTFFTCEWFYSNEFTVIDWVTSSTRRKGSQNNLGGALKQLVLEPQYLKVINSVDELRKEKSHSILDCNKTRPFWGYLAHRWRKATFHRWHRCTGACP